MAVYPGKSVTPERKRGSRWHGAQDEPHGGRGSCCVGSRAPAAMGCGAGQPPLRADASRSCADNVTSDIMNRILSGVRRPQNTHSGVQPAWSTPDRIGWTKPLHRGAGPTGNWNHRPRAPRHTGGANPLQADRHRGQVAPCPRLCTAAHPSTRSARGEVPPSAHARGPSRRGIHRSCRGEEQQHVAS